MAGPTSGITRGKKMSNRFRQRPELIAADMDGEKVMLSVSSGKYFALNELARFAWELMERPVTIDQIVSAVCEIYDVEHDRASRDVEKLVQDLVSKDLIEAI